MRAGTVAGLAGLVVLAATTAGAHHAWNVSFTEEKPVVVKGILSKVDLVNPHSWFYVDVKNKDGSVTTWGFEAEGPSTLQRSGIRPSDFKAGTKLKISGHPMKNGTPAAVWIDAVRDDGKKFDPREGFKVK